MREEGFISLAKNPRLKRLYVDSSAKGLKTPSLEVVFGVLLGGWVRGRRRKYQK